MNSPWSRLLPALVLLAACGGEAGSGGRGRGALPPGGTARDTSGADARRLGAEGLRVLDDVMAYGATRRRTPASLREAGIDSLTPTTARWLELADGQPVVWVGFRSAEGHALLACGVDRQAVEDRSLADGSYAARCRSGDGTVEVRRVAEEQ